MFKMHNARVLVVCLVYDACTRCVWIRPGDVMTYYLMTMRLCAECRRRSHDAVVSSYG